MAWITFLLSGLGMAALVWLANGEFTDAKGETLRTLLLARLSSA